MQVALLKHKIYPFQFYIKNKNPVKMFVYYSFLHLIKYRTWSTGENFYNFPL